jgi:hypothetical protein
LAIVELAAEQGLRVAFNAGGHNAGTIDWSKDTLLLKTERMQGIEIDRTYGVRASGRGLSRSRWQTRPASTGSPTYGHVGRRRRGRVHAGRRVQLDDPQARSRL